MQSHRSETEEALGRWEETRNRMMESFTEKLTEE